MECDIPTDDLDSLVMEDFSSNEESSEEDYLKSAVEALSGGIGSMQKTVKNQRNFASMLGSSNQNGTQRSFASMLESKKSGNQRSFATLLGKNKQKDTPTRDFSALLPKNTENTEATLILTPKVSLSAKIQT